MGVPGGDNASMFGALLVRVRAVVMSVANAKAPPAGLPKWAFLHIMSRLGLIALKAIRES